MDQIINQYTTVAKRNYASDRGALSMPWIVFMPWLLSHLLHSSDVTFGFLVKCLIVSIFITPCCSNIIPLRTN